MLSELFHNRTVLFASGPKGSYRRAIHSPERLNYYEALQVAHRLACATGLVKEHYFVSKERSLNFKIGENLIKIKRVALALEQLVHQGSIADIRDGKLFYPGTREEATAAIFNGLKKVKGYGIKEEMLRERLGAKAVSGMLVEKGKRPVLDKARQFLNTWGFYDQMMDWASKDMACGKVICDHKKLEAEKVVTSIHPSIIDFMLMRTEKEARSTNIESIKKDLQADNPKPIPPAEVPGGEKLPTLDFVVSDLHLREYHHENTDDILRFIWMVKKLNGRLILAGDTFDVWRSGGLEKCWVGNSRIVNALTKLREVILIAGNHDEFLHRLARRGGIFANSIIKVVEEYISPDRRIRIFHGHQFDRFNRPGSWIGRLLTRAITMMEMSFLKRLLETAGSITSGTLKAFGGLASFFLGPKISDGFILLLKMLLPTSYVLNRQVKNIMEWLESELEVARGLHGIEPSEDKPVRFIIGHIHYEGISFLAEKLSAAVKEKYGDSVELIVTDSWTNGQGYIGDYVTLAQTGIEESMIAKRVWWQEGGSPYVLEDIRG